MTRRMRHLYTVAAWLCISFALLPVRHYEYLNACLSGFMLLYAVGLVVEAKR